MPTFTSVGAVVRLDVLALRGDQPLLGLGGDDFEVRDNGVLQQVRVTAGEALRWKVIVLLDTSQSVAGPKLAAFRDAAHAIAKAARPGDDIALMTFSDRVELRSGISGLDDIRAGGSTALCDAIFAALAVAEEGDARPLVILLSDGADTMSWLSADDVAEAARRSEATVYAISTTAGADPRRSPIARPTWESIAEENDERFLQRIARDTGGLLLRAPTPVKLQERIASVLETISARYLIGYEPTGVSRDGWHDVSVRLRRGSGEIVARPGYFANAIGGR